MPPLGQWSCKTNKVDLASSMASERRHRSMSLKRAYLSLMTVCLLLPVLAVSGAGNGRYQATLAETIWAIQTDKDQCVLSHTVPKLGIAQFIQSSAKPLTFRLTIPQESRLDKQVQWRVMPLPWNHDLEPQELGQQQLTKENSTLELSPKASLHLYQELEKGLSAEFVFSNGPEDLTAITVGLSAVRFHGQMKAFRTCVAGLIKLADKGEKRTGKVVAEFKIPFSANSYELGDAARTILGDRARDYRVSKSRSRIIITGYTDSKESPNAGASLAQRRAREIKGYLVRRGLPADLMEVRQSDKRSAVDAANAVELPRATVWLVN